MDKRLPKRLFARIRAEYGVDHPDQRGVVLNLSAEGVFLSGRVVNQPHQPLAIRIFPDGVAPIDLRGLVRWAQRSPPNLRSIVREGMGIQLIDPPAAYLDYFQALTESLATRDAPRVEAAFHVRFRHRGEFVQQYTENISAGGLFIATAEPVEHNAVVDVVLFIPDLAREITIKGRVVYHLDEAQAARVGSAPGIGVQIVDMNAADRDAFRDYVERVLQRYQIKSPHP